MILHAMRRDVSIGPKFSPALFYFVAAPLLTKLRENLHLIPKITVEINIVELRELRFNPITPINQSRETVDIS